MLSALVRRFCDAVDQQRSSVELWGTGSARREFIHVDDVVDGMLFLMDRVAAPGIINLGTGKDVAIKELAEAVAQATGFKGEIAWDPSKPDGMPRKCLDCTQLESMGFSPKISLVEGIRRTVEEYRLLKAQSPESNDRSPKKGFAA